MKYFSFLFAVIISISLIACIGKKDTVKSKDTSGIIQSLKTEPHFVLAQWSFNKETFKGEMNTLDFINVAGELGFEGVEYVNQFFLDKVEDTEFLDGLKAAAKKANVKSTLLMIDKAGVLGDSDPEKRKDAVEQHKKWMDAAARLDCPTIRVNAHGDGTAQEMMDAVESSVKELSNYGKSIGVGVIIENHGMHSSDGKWLSELVGKVVPYGAGSLADFDNWCIEREGGALWGAPCIKEYDRYQGMKELLPTAKSVSVKAFEFDKDGYPIRTDFKKMFQLIHDAQYDEYLAIEFEGHDMPGLEGVKKTFEIAKKLYISDKH